MKSFTFNYGIILGYVNYLFCKPHSTMNVENML